MYVCICLLFSAINDMDVSAGYASWSLFSKSSSLVIQLSDCNDHQNTMVLQTVLVMNIVSSRACPPTHTRDASRNSCALQRPRTNLRYHPHLVELGTKLDFLEKCKDFTSVKETAATMERLRMRVRWETMGREKETDSQTETNTQTEKERKG